MIVAVVAAATVVAGIRAVHTGRVMPRTEVAGLSVGGLRESELRARLVERSRADRAVGVSAAGRAWRVRLGETGYRVDVDATTRRVLAAGRAGPLAGAWSTLRGLVATRRVEPVAGIDRSQLDEAVASLAGRIDRPAFPGAIRVDLESLTVKTMAPRTGRTVERAALRAALVEALNASPRVSPVAVREAPTVPAGRVQEVADAAQAFLRRPLEVRGGPDRTLTVAPSELARLLVLDPLDGGRNVRLGVQRSSLAALAGRLARRRDRRTRDATIMAPARLATLDGKGDLSWRPRRAGVTIAPGRSGRRVDRRLLARRMVGAVRAGRHRVTLPVEDVPPAVTTAAARKVRFLVGTFTTRYEPGQPRVTNIRRIARTVDGTIVAPGGRFSLNAATGPRTRDKGYVKAPFIADGRIVPSVGGGVSQFSTTLYNAVYFAGLRVETHQPHSLYIDRYPPGREATLNFPDIDLAWINDTDAPVLIRTSSDGTSVTVSLYGATGGRRVRAVALDNGAPSRAATSPPSSPGFSATPTGAPSASRSRRRTPSRPRATKALPRSRDRYRRRPAPLALFALAVPGHAPRLVDGEHRGREQQEQAGACVQDGRSAPQAAELPVGGGRPRRHVGQEGEGLHVQQQDAPGEDVDDQLRHHPVVAQQPPLAAQ